MNHSTDTTKNSGIYILPHCYKIGIISLDINGTSHKLLGTFHTKSLATEAIKKHILDTLSTENTSSIWIDFEEYKEDDWSGIKPYFQNELKRISENNRGETLIIGISLLGHYMRLKYLSDDILKAKKQNSNFVFLLGGANFPTIPPEEQLQLLKGYGIDLLSIGGGKSITEFLKKIAGKDALQRNTQGELEIQDGIEIPNNFILTTANKEQLQGKQAGEPIKSLVFLRKKGIDYSFSNSCSNSCEYCSANKGNFGIDVASAIKEINGALATYDSPIEQLNLQDLNPLQGNIKPFMTFLHGLEWNKINGISIFGDFMSLSTEKGVENVEQVLDLFNDGELKDKKIFLWIAMDSIHYKNDGEFLGRNFGTKNFSEEGHVKALASFQSLLDKYAPAENIRFSSSFIFHPAMNLEMFHEKFQLMKSLHDKGVEKSADYTLRVFPNTQIQEKYGQHTIPQYLLHTYDVHEEYASQRSLFYKNSALLDILAYLGYKERTLHDKVKLFNDAREWIIKSEEEGVQTRIVALRFFDYEKERIIKNDNLVEKRQFLKYIHFILERERYIFKNNCEEWLVEKGTIEQEKIKKRLFIIKDIKSICDNIGEHILGFLNEKGKTLAKEE